MVRMRDLPAQKQHEVQFTWRVTRKMTKGARRIGTLIDRLCYDCCMEESRTKDCTVPGCTEKRHSDQLCKVHTQSKRREQYSISQEKFNTVKCPLCGGEFPPASRGKGIEPCQKKSNPACYLRCRAFIANGVQCRDDRRAKGKVEPKRYL
jgi:hypothetical protein